MFNLLWGILFVIVNFAFFLVCYRLFGKKGSVRLGGNSDGYC